MPQKKVSSSRRSTAPARKAVAKKALSPKPTKAVKKVSAVKGAGSPVGKFRIRFGQRAEQSRVVRLGAARREVAAGVGRKPGAPGDGADDMSLYLDRDRRGRRGRELRIERAGDSIGALCGEGGRGIEQPEVARVRDMDETVFHLRDRPRQEFVERAGCLKIEAGEIAPEVGGVQGGRDASLSDPVVGLDQFAGQEIVPSLAIGRYWKETGAGRRGLGSFFDSP